MIDASTVIMAALAVAAFLVLWWRSGRADAIVGAREGLSVFLMTAPRLFAAFVLAGMMQVLIPRELVARWLSDASGMRGILFASAAGALTPGGPFLQFPIVAAIYKMGAGTAPIVAYLTAWSLMGVHRIILWEIPFLGPRLTFTRLAFSLPVPILVGSATRWLLRALA